MRRVLLLLLLGLLAGCGVSTKDSEKKPSPAPVVNPPESEVYDKVAPMPREAKPK
jgi:hypothetical protein